MDDDRLPEPIRVRNWIPFTPDQDVDVAAQRLVDALDTDLSHAHAHTRWLVKALDWDEHERDASFLLRGSELADAEAWLASVSDAADPAPTSLQREYLYASRRASVGASAFLVVREPRRCGDRGRPGCLCADQPQPGGFGHRRVGIEATGVGERRPARGRSRAVDPARDGSDQDRRDAGGHVRAAAGVGHLALSTGAPGERWAPTLQRILGPAVSYSPNGRLLAEGSEGGFVTIFETATGHVIKRIQIGAQAPVVAFNPAGTLLAVGTNQDVQIVDPSTGVIRQVAKTGDLTWGPFSWSADGRTVYFADLDDASAGTSPRTSCV